MKVVKQRAEYMVCLNSYFISEFSEEVAVAIKATRPDHLGGDKYLGKGVWEVTEEVWNRIKHFPHTFIDGSAPKPYPLILSINEGNPLGKYHYQDIAAEELRNRKECLLFFDTGTGKTRTTLLALSHLSKDLDAVIVVGESNLSKGWMSQVQEHFPEMQDRFIILNDGKSIPNRIKVIQSAEKGSIFILNIESVRNKALVEALNARNLAVSVLDECQYIIGANSQQTAGMQSLKSIYRWALSATPIMNSPLEWYSLLAWLRVIKFDGVKTRFKEYYAYAVWNKYGQLEYSSFRHEEDLEDLKNLVAIRVEKAGLGLPIRHIEEVELEKDSDYESLIKQINKEKKKEWIDATFSVVGQEVYANTTSGLFYIERIATSTARQKIDFVLKQRKEPMVVVSNLKFPLNYIHSLMPQESVLYHGDIPEPERVSNLSSFKSGKSRVLLMTRKSGGTGLDGLQRCARIMVFLDAPDNIANFNQCADRLHRVGQEKEVFIYIPKIKDSLDIYSWEHIGEKQGWIDRYYQVKYGVE